VKLKQSAGLTANVQVPGTAARMVAWLPPRYRLCPSVHNSGKGRGRHPDGIDGTPWLVGNASRLDFDIGIPELNRSGKDGLLVPPTMFSLLATLKQLLNAPDYGKTGPYCSSQDGGRAFLVRKGPRIAGPF